MSAWRRAARAAAAPVRSRRSPARWPQASLACFRPSMSTTAIAKVPPSRTSRSSAVRSPTSYPRRSNSPVSGSSSASRLAAASSSFEALCLLAGIHQVSEHAQQAKDGFVGRLRDEKVHRGLRGAEPSGVGTQNADQLVVREWCRLARPAVSSGRIKAGHLSWCSFSLSAPATEGRAISSRCRRCRVSLHWQPRSEA